MKYVRLGSTLPSPLGESMPRKGYKRAPGRSVGMPEVMSAQNFNRRISAEEALILATAGDRAKQHYRRFEIAFNPNSSERFQRAQLQPSV